MGREIRKVPSSWEHPKDEKEHFKPLFDWTYAEALKLHFLNELPGHLWPPICWQYLPEWFKCWPSRECYRPRWDDNEATHFQIYENVTEGTPVSPVFESLNEMKKWLLEQGFSERAASIFVKDGYAPTFIFSPEKGVSGMGIHSLDW